jgi:hypothetical protein
MALSINARVVVMAWLIFSDVNGYKKILWNKGNLGLAQSGCSWWMDIIDPYNLVCRLRVFFQHPFKPIYFR